MSLLDEKKLIQWGMRPNDAGELLRDLRRLEGTSRVECWSQLRSRWLKPDQPFDLHLALYQSIYGEHALRDDPQPAWLPSETILEEARISAWQQRLGCDSVADLHRWSVEHRAAFWADVVEALAIPFIKRPRAIWDLEDGASSPRYLPGAVMNIAAACFRGDATRVAIFYADEAGRSCQWSLHRLKEEVTRVAGSLRAGGLRPGFRAAVMMPMTPESVAIYLGIIWAGGAVVAIADSFAPPEVMRRLEITGADLLFVQGRYVRSGKTIDLYDRLSDVPSPPAVVVGDASLRRPEDEAYSQWLTRGQRLESFEPSEPTAATNYLFSSGTTGTPKAIPWNHATPIKCGSDAMFHQDIRAGDVVAWPTNLGWMMGPWLIYASLMNEAAMALYGGSPLERGFAEFVADSHVTMLGVVPSLVRSWRMRGTLEGIDWSAIRCFSSTGECSQAEDVLYLMSRAGYRPMIEYCGGTELAGGYITSTVVEPSSPSVFTTPTMGLDFVVLDEHDRPAETGEVFLIPPSFGLSTELLNRDHHAAYYAGTPTLRPDTVLRRHGDLVQRLGPGRYRVLGRADDTMNLGGIKVSSAEIERVVASLEGIREAAAVAVPPPGGGPSQLYLFVVLDNQSDTDLDALSDHVRQCIKQQLNPLFKLERLVPVDSLPRTASNKVMRRKLRESAAL